MLFFLIAYYPRQFTRMAESKKIIRNYANVSIDDLVELIEDNFYGEYYIKFDRFCLIL